MAKESVVVVINSYNHGKFIDDCVKSVRQQTYKNFCIYFYDAGSTDNTREIIHDLYDKDSNVLFDRDSKTTLGTLPIGISRYFGVLKAIEHFKPDYIAILDADDMWLPNKLEKQIKKFQETDAKLVFSDCYYWIWKEKVKQVENYPAWTVEQNGEVLKQTFFDKYPPLMKDSFFSLLTRYSYIPCPTIMFETKALKEVIGNPMAYTSAEDYDWILKMTAKYPCVYVDEPLAYYRIHKDQLTKKTPVRNTFEEIDCVKRARHFRKLSKREDLEVSMHIFKLYLKMIYKEMFYD